MMILKTTLVCLLGLGLSACTVETESSEASSAKKADVAKTPAAKTPVAKEADVAKTPAADVAMTTTALKLSKIP